MVYDYFDKYTFTCDMYDKDSDTIVELVLNYFPLDNSCQIINSKTGKKLFRRIQVPHIKPAMLQVGNVINVFSKLLLITDCAPATMRTLFSHSESTFAMIKPVSPSEHGKILTFISKRGFRIVRMQNGRVNKDFAMSLYRDLGGSNTLPIIVDYITSGEVIGLELVAPDAVQEWVKALGATNPAEAAPGTLRNMYGENVLRNVAHAVKSRAEAVKTLDYFFGEENGKPRVPLRATFKNCTCCVIKPHAIIDGNLGSIIEHIATSDKFYVSAMAMFSLSIPDAKEFYEVYNGVLPGYEDMCIHLAEGKCIALEVKCKDPSVNVVWEFRKLCGPHDPVYDYFDKYTFMCEMYEEDSDTIAELVLHYFPFDNSFQVMNLNKGKKLLRRTQVPYLKPAMLQVGNIINVFSKLLLIKDCAPATMRTLFNRVESTFALIKPVSPSMHGKIITFILKKGFRIVAIKNGTIDKDFAMELYKNIRGSNMLPIIIDYLTSGEVIGLELVAPNAVSEWVKALGATDPATAAPGTLRKIFGENILKNIAHAVKSKKEAIKSLEVFFGHDNGKLQVPFKATFKNCTCCVIKPHAVTDGNVGNIIEHIATSDKFYVSAMAMFSLKITDASEFYEIYAGVLPAYEAMCIHLAEGKCLVLEVKCKDPSMNVVSEFRKLCGPRDPDLCRQLYPDSIRALYGKTVIQNAVHCTDLPEDGELEVEYFFKLLAGTY